eukprot:3496326-Rhodomonas_salina.2
MWRSKHAASYPTSVQESHRGYYQRDMVLLIVSHADHELSWYHRTRTGPRWKRVAPYRASTMHGVADSIAARGAVQNLGRDLLPGTRCSASHSLVAA